MSTHNICFCRDSLEAPLGGASNEYPQHMFLSRNKKKKNCEYPLLSVAISVSKQPAIVSTVQTHYQVVQ